jgi:hypothetical protein
MKDVGNIKHLKKENKKGDANKKERVMERGDKKEKKRTE